MGPILWTIPHTSIAILHTLDSCSTITKSTKVIMDQLNLDYCYRLTYIPPINIRRDKSRNILRLEIITIRFSTFPNGLKRFIMSHKIKSSTIMSSNNAHIFCMEMGHRVRLRQFISLLSKIQTFMTKQLYSVISCRYLFSQMQNTAFQFFKQVFFSTTDQI